MPEPDHARVVLVAGPSGAGKTHLCRRLGRAHGWAVVRLDDFYKDVDDPTLPMSDIGIPDWDDVGSWRTDDACAALRDLVTTGRADVPEYSISASRRTGTHEVTSRPGDVVLAEGIFAADLVERLRAEGLLADAWCVRRTPWLTFCLRLVRDLRERRKPPRVLWQRGLALRRLDRAIVARHTALGARPLTPRRAAAVAETLARPAGGR